MTQPGYNPANEGMWWWKVALHLDEAHRALANAMAHNVDDPRFVHALHDRLREGQAILLEIFRVKGLLPGQANGAKPPPIQAPMPVMTEPAVPDHMIEEAEVAADSALVDVVQDAAPNGATGVAHDAPSNAQHSVEEPEGAPPPVPPTSDLDPEAADPEAAR